MVCALRIIEFLLPRLDVDVSVGEFAEIDLGTLHVQLRYRALDRHVAQIRVWQAFRSEAVDRIHGDAVAVRVDELFIDPVAAALGKLFDIQLAGGEHHLAHVAVDLIAIDIHVREIVIGADFLDLPQRILQGMPVPQPDF